MLLTRLAPAALLVGLAAAQEPFPFQIDQAASSWQWSGTSSLGPILGNPSTDFELAGNFFAELDDGAFPIASIEFLPGGSAAVVPDLSGRIPNPVSFLPDLAVIDVTNLTLEFVAPPTSVDAAGDFTAMVTVNVLTGTLTVTPLSGSQTVTDLAGTSGAPQPVSGNVSQSGHTLTVDSPQNTQFDFVDPGSGISATLTLVGTLHGDASCGSSANYCVTNPNSTGASAAIAQSGSTRLQDDDLVLEVTSLPTNSLGYFLFSETQGFNPLFGGFSSGNLCLDGQIFRLSNFLQDSGGSGTVSFQVPFGSLPPGAGFDPGEDWNFQYWFRDAGPAGPTSNTSDAVAILFCP